MFIKNKIMVSLKKYIIKWLKILQTPIVKKYHDDSAVSVPSVAV